MTSSAKTGSLHLHLDVDEESSLFDSVLSVLTRGSGISDENESEFCNTRLYEDDETNCV